MKMTFVKLSFILLFLTSFETISQSGIILPHGIKVPEVTDLDQVVSPVEGMMVYSELQKSLYLRKAESWEILSEAIPNSDAHIFLEIADVVPDLYDEAVSAGVHSSESKILDIDFSILRKMGTQSSVSAVFKFKKKVGRSSLIISKSIIQNINYPELVFTFYVRNPNTLTDIPYYRYTLENVIFIADQIIGPHPELSTLVQSSPQKKPKSLIEEVQIAFESIEIEDLVNNTSFQHTFNYAN
ncbi:Type VI protein secretion system component Hcp (secreted cytotoxin) [Spirosomataceae bacterium TFI 002]|nr:Type VI protein secretion system component Hcp (secreted cytotoxin) [Spirosomataceae bacterium TFI 002]